MLNSILNNGTAASVSIQECLVCMAASLILGVALAWIYAYRNRVSKNFLITLVSLPAVVQMVIMMVNGNLGTGVAVMGAFSLVRFRSAPGNAREISSIFAAMAVGLAAGMGYIGAAVMMTAVVGIVTMAVLQMPDGDATAKRELKVTIPENLDYSGIFDDLFQRYTDGAELLRVRTVNMGSLYELQYHIAMKDVRAEKEFLDQIRCRNGNLGLVCGRIPSDREEL